MIIGEPVRELINPVFWIKMVLVLTAVLVTSGSLGRAPRRRILGVPASGRRIAIRTAAVAIVLLWFAIMVAGPLDRLRACSRNDDDTGISLEKPRGRSVGQFVADLGMGPFRPSSASRDRHRHRGRHDCGDGFPADRSWPRATARSPPCRAIPCRWTWTAFVLAAITGARCLFVSRASSYAINPWFSAEAENACPRRG